MNKTTIPSKFRSIKRMAAGAAVGAVCLMAGAGAAHSQVITGETATANQEFGGRVAQRAVNDSGLTGLSHSTSYGDMWQSNGYAEPIKLTIDLGAVYTLDSVQVWNYNEPGNTNRGIGQTVITVSLDNIFDAGDFQLVNTFNSADGLPTYTGEVLDLANPVGRFVQFDVQTRSGGGYGFLGASEIQFTAAVPEPSSFALLGTALMAGFAMLRRKASKSS